MPTSLQPPAGGLRAVDDRHAESRCSAAHAPHQRPSRRSRQRCQRHRRCLPALDGWQRSSSTWMASSRTRPPSTATPGSRPWTRTSSGGPAWTTVVTPARLPASVATAPSMRTTTDATWTESHARRASATSWPPVTLWLPEGEPGDPPGFETVSGLGLLKNGVFLQRAAREGVEPVASTVEFVDRLLATGRRVAVISASENATQVLRAAGVLGRFGVKVDGLDARRLQLPGKPDPAIFLEAARRLGEAPGRVAIVEDALAGVQAGVRGGFAFVLAIDRAGFGRGARRRWGFARGPTTWPSCSKAPEDLVRWTSARPARAARCRGRSRSATGSRAR